MTGGSSRHVAGAAGTRVSEPPEERRILTDVSANLIYVSVTLFVFFATILILCHPSEITACSIYLQLRPATNFLGTICSCLSWLQGTPGTTSLSASASLGTGSEHHQSPSPGTGESLP